MDGLASTSTPWPRLKATPGPALSPSSHSRAAPPPHTAAPPPALLAAVKASHPDSACTRCRPNFLFTVRTLAAVGVEVIRRISPLRPRLR
jgi:hypothetical protein